MGYLALYREFRPQTFDEVIDQEHIVETLKNQIMSKKIGHAYLFCGTRGVGKTSCAKILAKAVNCLSPRNGSPCGECEVCKSIQSNGNLDIVEIDAASNNGVDQIRDLREKVNFLPTVAKYKVYIIDEVHMLTESAFNALLKTLEEPPEHVIFILATTEPEKIPATILSRCMRFDFKLVDNESLTKLLKEVFDKIGVKYDENAVDLIAKAGKGSVRDTLSIAEMCKAYTDKKLSGEVVEKCLGFTDNSTIKEIVNAVVGKNGSIIIEKIENIYNSGKNLSVLLTEISEYFKNILIKKIVPNFDLGMPENILKEYQDIGEKCDEKFLVEAIKTFSISTNEIKTCDDQKSYIIAVLLGLFYDPNMQIENLKNRIAILENYIKNGDFLQNNSENSKKNSENLQKNAEKIENNGEKVLKDKEKNAYEIFGELIKFARENNEFILHQAFEDVKDVKIENEKIIFVCGSQDIEKVIKNRSQIVLKFLNSRYNINMIGFEIISDHEKDDLKELKKMFDGKVKVK